MKKLPNLFRYLTPNTWLRKARLEKKLYYYTILGLIFLIGGGIFLFQLFNPFNAKAAWYNNGWKYRMQLAFDNSGQSTNLTNFPVMVHLTSSNFDFSKADVNGRDLRFTDSDGTTLINYEVEKWDKAGKDAVMYVKVPQIDASSATDSIYLYYGGNDTTSYIPNSANVWPSDMQGRFHMSEKAVGTNAVVSNAASSSATLFEYGSAASDTGTSAGAIRFSGSSANTQGNSGLFQEPITYYGKVNESDPANSTIRLASSSATLQVAQGFMVPRTVNIGSIRVEWGDTGTPTAVAHKMTIQTDSGGLPSGSTITGGTSSCYTLSQAIGSSGDTRNFRFASRPQVIAGTQYHFVIQSFTDTNCTTPKVTAESGFNYHQIWNDSTGEYAGGSLSVYDGATWTSLSNADAVFDIYDDTFNVTGAITVGAWVRPTTSGGREILNKGTKTYGNWYGQQGYALRTDSSMQPFFYINRGTMQTEIGVTSSTALNLNQWNYVVGRVDGSTIKVYVNGVETGSSNTTLLPAFTGDPLAIANNSGFNTADWQGQIDEAFVYNGALSSDWIKASFLSENGTFTTYAAEEKGANVYDPVAYWRFDEGQGTIARDSSRGGYDGTLSGSTLPAWKADQCVTEKCLYFNGVTSNVSVSKTVSGVKSVGFWVNPTASNSGELMTLNSSVHLRAISGTVSAPGMTSPSIYVNGTLNGAINANTWNYIEVTSGTAVSASAITLGKGPLGVLNGYLDEIKFYDYVRTASQIKADFAGSGNVLGAKDQSFLTKGLVGYWKMDEASWTTDCATFSIVDSSGNGNNARSCPNGSGPSATTSAKFGNAGSFDGVDDRALVNYSNSLNLPDGFTFSTWLYNGKATGTTDGKILLYHETYLTNGFRIWVNVNNTLTLATDQSGGNLSVTTPTALAQNKWYHLTFTYSSNNSTGTIYINGKKEASGTGTYIPNTSANFEFADASGDARYNLNAYYDEARLYNRALSSTEAEGLYNYAPGPVTYYDFEEGQGSSLNDKSGNSVSATFTGSPSWASGKYGKAVNFSGTSTYATLGGSNSPLSSPAAWTYAAWIKPTSASVSTSDGIVGQVNNPRLTWGDNTGPGSTKVNFFVGWSDAPGYTSVSSGNISLNQWHYVVGTADSADLTNQTLKLYIDGVLVSTTTKTTGILTRPNGTHYINKRDSSLTFPGSIDEVRIYNYARTGRQIVEDMNASHPVGGSPVGSMLGWWDFDEGYGTTVNNSGSTGSLVNGTLTNMASPATTVSGWTNDGKHAKSLSFDGINDYVSMANYTSLNPGTDDFSVAFWLKTTTAGDIIQTSNSNAISFTQGFGIIVGSASFTGCQNKIVFGMANGTTRDSLPCSNKTVTDGAWHHVVVSVTRGSKIDFFIDGKLNNSATTSLTGSVTNTRFTVGQTWWTAYLSGRVDDLKYYNYALGSSDVKIDYNKGGSLKFGVLGTNPDGRTASNSAERAYCPPGDTSAACAPVAELGFEEGSGASASDTSGNGNTGTFAGGAAWALGKVGKGAYFDGVNSYVSVVDDNSIDFASNQDFTVQAWVKTLPSQTDTAATDNSIIEKWTSAGGYPYVFRLLNQTSGNNGKVRVRRYDGTNNPGIDSTKTINDNKWHHVVFVKNGSLLSLYIDRLLDGTATDTTTGTTTNASNLFIGQRGSNTNHFTGTLDQILIYNYARTPAQIAWDYDHGKPIAYWDMDECQGSSVYDLSGNGLIGTINLSTTGSQTNALGVGTCTESASTPRYNGRTGKYNASLNFDGINDNVTVPDGALTDITGSFSISAWVKSAVTPSTSYGIVAKGSVAAGTTNAAYGLFLGATGTFGFRVSGNNTTTTNINSIRALSANTWHHVVGVYTAIGNGTSLLDIYVDGVKSAAQVTTAPYPLATNNLTLKIGSSTDNSDNLIWPWNGQIDDVQIFNYPVTAAQVRNLYNQSSAVRFGPSTGTP